MISATSSSFVILLIATHIVSLPLDSNYVGERKFPPQLKSIDVEKVDSPLHDLDRPQRQAVETTSAYDFTPPLKPAENRNESAKAEIQRRRKEINNFVITVLENVRKFANKRVQTKIDHFLDQNAVKESKNTRTHEARNPVQQNAPTPIKRFSVDELVKEVIKQELMRLDEINRLRRQSDDEDDDAGEDAQPGGLAGLIASLSGGDDGSDVGALVGALSTVITNLLGPGGLDISSLLSTGTSLIAGLLGGDEGFAKVLAGYIGTAIEGVSGGGGAENNGMFFGNFIGALLASLSADPEEDSDEDPLPARPTLFLQNFVHSFHEASSRTVRRDGDDGHKGSDSFSFISHIVSSIVGGITNIIAGASLGTSGGFSQGSVSASGASSGHKHHDSLQIN